MTTWFIWEPSAVYYDHDPWDGAWASIVRAAPTEVDLARDILGLAGHIIAEISAVGSASGDVATIQDWCNEQLRGALPKAEREARQKAIAAGLMTAKVPR